MEPSDLKEFIEGKKKYGLVPNKGPRFVRLAGSGPVVDLLIVLSNLGSLTVVPLPKRGLYIPTL